MPPAARLGDMHTCPLATPGTPPVPHVGGPILPACCPTVLIGMMPAARVGDMLVCVGPPDTIALGSPTVLIGNMMAARLGDPTAHGGVITVGFPTVQIGIPGSGGTVGNPARAAGFFPGQQANKDTCALMSTQGIVQQNTGTAFTEGQMQAIGTASGAYTVCNGTTDEAAVMTAAGIPATLNHDPTMSDIVAALAQNRAVIVGLDARPLWGRTGPSPLGHAVRVTGVDLDANGNPTGVHINDTGSGQNNRTVPVATFQSAMDGWGEHARMATSNNPVP